jgi:hypothetical protein
MPRTDRLRHALGKAVIRYHSRLATYGPMDIRSDRAGHTAAKLAVAWLESREGR